MFLATLACTVVQATTINFDGIDTSATGGGGYLSTQYTASDGGTFVGGRVQVTPTTGFWKARSPRQNVVNYTKPSDSTSTLPITITFSAAQATFGIYVSHFAQVTLKAYDDTNALVTTQVLPANTSGVQFDPLALSYATNRIKKITIAGEGEPTTGWPNVVDPSDSNWQGNFVMDDMSFTRVTETPPTTTTPEPMSALLLVTGAGALLPALRRRRS